MTICCGCAREDGITVIFVTHSVMESSYLSDRVLVMTPRPGHIAADIVLPPGRDDRLSPATSKRSGRSAMRCMTHGGQCSKKNSA